MRMGWLKLWVTPWSDAETVAVVGPADELLLTTIPALYVPGATGLLAAMVAPETTGESEVAIGTCADDGPVSPRVNEITPPHGFPQFR